MFYPNHHCRSYCLYLGSLEYNNQKLDMGVYEHPNDLYVSHAIVYGEEDSQYMSGIIDFEKIKYNFTGAQYQINKLLYEDYLKRKIKNGNKNLPSM
jgi:hypothetical protein